MPFNVFQRLNDGSDLWRSVVGVGYEAWLDAEELATLNVLYQKRHLLAHCEGIVDQKYVEKSGDPKYKSGQRLVVSQSDVAVMLSSLEKLGTGLKKVAAKP